MKCLYCGSRAKDDNYGNCSSCGAPREEIKDTVQPHAIEIFGNGKLQTTFTIYPDNSKLVNKVIAQDFDYFIKGYKKL